MAEEALLNWLEVNYTQICLHYHCQRVAVDALMKSSHDTKPLYKR